MTRATKPRKQPAQARSRQTVADIVEAGARILADEGYGRLTTNKVADLAGVSIGSLYQYFPNKEALVCAIHARHQARVRDAMRGDFAPAQGLAGFADVRQLIASVVQAHRVEPKLHARFESLRQDGTLSVELGEIELGQIAGALETMLQTHFADRIEDAALSSWILVTTVHALVQAHERGDLPCGTDRLLDEITHLVSGYVTARH